MAWIRKRGKTPDGRQRYLVEWRDPDGDRRGKTIAGHDEALAFRRQIEDALARGRYVDPRAGGIAFGAYAEEWLRTAAHLRPSTRLRYSSLLRNHVLPALGRRPLNGIRPADLRAFIGSETERGLAPKSIRHSYTLLVGILRAAREDGLIEAVPIPRRERGGRGVLPTAARREQRFLTHEEVAQLAGAMPERYRAMVFVGAYAALRWGEAAGLRIERVRLLEGKLEIVETLEGEPKWGSAGTIRISPELAEILADHLRAYPPGEGGLVFTAPSGGALRYPNFYRRAWRPAVERADLAPLRFHDLRHTAAALAIAEGAHPKAIQELLRHRSISTTLDLYGHLLPGLHEDLAERLGAGIVRTPADNLPTTEPSRVVQLRPRGRRRAP